MINNVYTNYHTNLRILSVGSGRSKISRKGVHIFIKVMVGARFADFSLIFLKCLMKMK